MRYNSFMATAVTGTAVLAGRNVHLTGKIGWICIHCGQLNMTNVRASSWSDRCSGERCHRTVRLRLVYDDAPRGALAHRH